MRHRAFGKLIVSLPLVGKRIKAMHHITFDIGVPDKTIRIIIKGVRSGRAIHRNWIGHLIGWVGRVYPIETVFLQVCSPGIGGFRR